MNGSQEQGQIIASEIKRQAAVLEIRINELSEPIGRITTSLDNISATIPLEDSDLSIITSEFNDAYKTIFFKLREFYITLSNIMDDFSSKSIENEINTSNELNQLNSELDSLNIGMV